MSWLRVRETKSGRPLELPVTRQLREVLERRRAASGADEGWVFPGPGGRGPYKRAGHWYPRISQGAGTKFWFHACRNCFITVAVRDLMLPESLVKRLVNHTHGEEAVIRSRPRDESGNAAAVWSHSRIVSTTGRAADRVE